MEMASENGPANPIEGPLPKNVFECLVHDNWRKWDAAIQRGIEGWDERYKAKECLRSDVPKKTVIIKVGELYTYKRDGRAKHRAVIMGNMLRAARDYYYTHSYTFSQDSFRLFMLLAAALGKKLCGRDAQCGYLQATPLKRDPFYMCMPRDRKSVV